MAILPIGFFMPLPLAMMIPFMGIQSAVMMKQAGENWQYGKRLQSAMTNEEFNAQTFASIYQKNVANTKEIIPDMKIAIQDMREFQDFIIVEIIELMRRGLETGLGAIFGLSAEQSNQFFGGTTGPPLLEEGTGTPSPGENLGGRSFSENTIKSWSLITLTERKSQPFIGTVDDATQELIVKWFIIRREEAKKRQKLTVPGTPIELIGDYQIPPQQFISSLQVKALNKMIKLKQFRNYYIVLNARWATADRSIKTARSSTDRDRWTNIKAAWTKIILDSNKNLPTS